MPNLGYDPATARDPISNNVMGSSPGTPGASNTQYDPWSTYRASAGTQLATSSQNDPSAASQAKLQQMMTGGPNSFTPDDPSYSFRFSQGQQALERTQGSQGLLNSGNAAAELQAYGQNTASTEYAAQFQRVLQGMQGIESNYNASQTRLMAMAGVGANPTAGGQLGVEQGNLQLNRDKFNWDKMHPGGNSGGGSGGGGGASSDPWASYYATQDAAAASQAAQKQAATPDYGAGSYDSGNYGGSTGGLDSSGNYSSGGGMTDMSVV